jgi:hypothetical protein
LATVSSLGTCACLVAACGWRVMAGRVRAAWRCWCAPVDAERIIVEETEVRSREKKYV